MRRTLIALLCILNFANTYAQPEPQTGAEDREYTIKMMQRIVDPILKPLSQNELKSVMPRRDWETDDKEFYTTYIQAFGRSLSGMAQWLALGVDDTPEGQLRKRYGELSRQCLINATDPDAADYMFYNNTFQQIVHIAYIAYPLLVAPEVLWNPLTDKQKENVITALKKHRQHTLTKFHNWVLFCSTIECAIWKLTGECNMEDIDLAVNKHKEWYLGDGLYGDGEDFHWDYYNSFVIQPLLLETLWVCKEMNSDHATYLPKALIRANRYAEVLEHMISPEGTFPVIGRSSIYRIAVFQHVGYVGARFGLPKTLSPGGTRAALTAVVKSMMEAPGTFDENGFLNAGVVGQQERAVDVYNFTGALYMCAMGLTHLGIAADDPFWCAPAEKWFQQRVWSGDPDIPNQKYLWD